MRALVLRKDGQAVSGGLEHVNLPAVDEPGVLCSVAYSSLNYKDALSITNKGKIVRQWPMVPGIDGGCRVEQSTIPELPDGADLVVTGWGLGETRWGCLAEQVWLPKDFPIARPVGLSLRDAMAVGTAGFTAMLCVLRIQGHGVRPEDGPVLVTGASGGVGGMALMFLKSLGYAAVACTGRPEETLYLESIGASRIVDRRELAELGKPLQREDWAAVVDSVGSATLANACASTRYGGIVAACGLAHGMDLPTTVAPFILRGITLAGIDSVMAPQALRQKAWDRVAELINRDALERMTREITLSETVSAAQELLAGTVRGRLVVNVRA
jgi:acrylyl-CoA reductase (NADPH)